MEDPKFIYIVGSHSVGKTTLINELMKKKKFCELKFQQREELARTIIENELTDMEKPIVKQEDMRILEHLVIRRQWEEEEKDLENAKQKNVNINGFLWDRGVADAIAYTKLFVGDEDLKKCLKLEHVVAMINRWNNHKQTLVFIVKPCPEFLENDGVRMDTRNMKVPMSIHNAILKFLIENDINYHEITMKNLDERAEFVIEKLEVTWPEIF